LIHFYKSPRDCECRGEPAVVDRCQCLGDHGGGRNVSVLLESEWRVVLNSLETNKHRTG